MPNVVNTREQMLEALPAGYDAIFLVDKNKFDSEFLDVAGKTSFIFFAQSQFLCAVGSEYILI